MARTTTPPTIPPIIIIFFLPSPASSSAATLEKAPPSFRQASAGRSLLLNGFWRWRGGLLLFYRPGFLYRLWRGRRRHDLDRVDLLLLLRFFLGLLQACFGLFLFPAERFQLSFV